ncbi:MAG: RNA 2'-phosphotransferase [Candidatus Jordarchaeaceae archaeon]
MEEILKIKISKYMSYLLRHNPENLKMDEYGFVNVDELLDKLKDRFQISDELFFEIVEKSERKRFEIIENKIRALYGHSVQVKIELEEDKTIKTLYHGTTPNSVSRILKFGLKPMGRKWVHFSPTIELAIEVGLRRTQKPVILEIDAEEARKDGIKFYKATDKVYLSGDVAPRYIKCIQPTPKSVEE